MPSMSERFTAAKIRMTVSVPQSSPTCCAPTSSPRLTSILPKSGPCARSCASAFFTSGAVPNCWPASIPTNWPTTAGPPVQTRRVRDDWEKQLLAAEDNPLRQLALKNDLAMIRHFDQQIFALEEELQRQTKQAASRDYTLLQSVPGRTLV